MTARKGWLALAGALALLFSTPVLAAPARELVAVEQQGCVYCERWEAAIGTIYAKTDEAKVLPLRRVDLSALPPDLASLRPIRYTPTFVVLDHGREVGRIEGYPGQDFFWGLLDSLITRLPHSTADAAQAATAPKPAG